MEEEIGCMIIRLKRIKTEEEKQYDLALVVTDEFKLEEYIDTLLSEDNLYDITKFFLKARKRFCKAKIKLPVIAQK